MVHCELAVGQIDEVEIGAVSRTEKLLGFLDRGREEFAGVENETSQT